MVKVSEQRLERKRPAAGKASARLYQVQRHIVAELRSEIVAGKMAPGSRIPSRVALEQRFSASPVTVQSAMRQLLDEGFVQVGARRMGTFVAEQPPHLAHYAMVFPSRPGPIDGIPTLFQMMEREAARLEPDGKRISMLYGFGGKDGVSDYQRLVEDVLTSRVAGLIFASSADEFAKTPLLEEPGIPRVAVAPMEVLPGVPKLYFDLVMLVRKALAYLQKRERRKVAVLCLATIFGGSDCVIFNELTRQMPAHGMEPRDDWMQFPDPRAPISAQRSVELLLSKDHPSRPDALLILNDHLVPGAIQGVLNAGLRIPDELEIVAHANFPSPAPSEVPVKRIGFDVRQLLSQGIDIIDMQRAGKIPPSLAALPALFDDEVQEA